MPFMCLKLQFPVKGFWHTFKQFVLLFPVMNTKRSDDSSASKDCVIDLDHNKFKCKVPGCSKAFRKAKLLDYHLKYYHNTEKDMDSEACSPERVGRTRATSASMPTSTLSDISDNKRRRTVSTSSCRFPEVHLCVLLVLMSEYEYYIILSIILFFLSQLCPLKVLCFRWTALPVRGPL